MLSIKHLNTDASFLITFEPLGPTSPHPVRLEAKPYHILLDPWIVGSSKIFHSKISLTKHKEPACVTSLRELPEPDLVIISQSKSDHCNEATLKQIPPSSKTIILAEPAAARVIQGWKHFDRRKVWALKKWEEPQTRRGGKGRHAVTRIQLPPSVPGGEPGEVTVAFIPQRRDLTGLHAAIGITFRSSSRRGAGKAAARMAKSCMLPPCVTIPISPPPTPKSHRSYPNLPAVYASAAAAAAAANGAGRSPPPPCPPSRLPNGHDFATRSPFTAAAAAADDTGPRSPTPTIRSVRSCSTLTPTNTISSTLSAAATLTNNHPHHTNSILATVAPRPAADRTLSVLFSPHGIPFAGNLESYATTHLVAEAALPLTALLHCFDRVRNPWWLGGDVLLGAPAGRDIAVRLGARCWVSCHDGDKDVRGLATGWVRTWRWDRDTLERAVTGEGRDAVGVFGGGGGGGGGGRGRSHHQQQDQGEDLEKETGGSPRGGGGGGEKLELRRVGSKLRLWPIPSSLSLSKDYIHNNHHHNHHHNNHSHITERKTERETSLASAPPPPPPPLPPLITNTNSTTGPTTKLDNQGTQVIDLASGEMVVLTSEGPWNVFRGQVVPL